MEYTLVLFFALGAIFCNAQLQMGYCEFQGTVNDPGIGGSVLFIQNGPYYIDMHVNVYGITLNKNQNHGIHIHQYGDISSASGAQAGTHWNPTNVSHACNGTRHYGDTGNWMVTPQGDINAVKTLDLIALTGGNSIIGLAVIIHSLVDDCNSTTSAGNRLAQCVIGIANPTYYNQTTNPAEGSTNITGAPQRAICVFARIPGNPITGWLLFEQDTPTSPVVVTGSFDGLNGTLHGLHIHQYGDLRTLNGSATGSHWNPTNSSHGLPGYPIRHVGDLGNIFYYETSGYYSYNHTTFGLSGSIYNILGHAVIIHSSEDICTQPVGGAGSRLAQCVIGIANPTTVYTIPNTVPTYQNITACPVYSTTGRTVSVTGGVSTGGASTGGSETSISSVMALPLVLLFLIVFFL